jgi:hypothetical protein
MQNYDISHLPAPVHDAVLQVLEALVQAFPLAPAEAVRVDGPSAASPPRFPRSATELLVLEALEAIAPAPVSPQQLAAMIHKPHLEVRTILQALAMLGTIAHPAKGLYRDQRVEDDFRPSTRFAAQIAALCQPSTSRGPTVSPAREGTVSHTEGVAHG